MEYLRALTIFATVLAATLVSNNIEFAKAETTLDPLKQVQSGVMPQDVKCNVGFVLIIRSSNDQPACVKPTTEQRLLSHGWITVEKFETKQVNHDKTTVTVTNENAMPTVNGASTVIASTMQHQNMTVLNGSSSSTVNTITQKNIILPLNDTSKTNANIIGQSNITLSNDASNATGTNDTGNGTITASMVYNWYNYSVGNNLAPQLASRNNSPLPALQVTPTVSSTSPNSIKVLMIGMSPNPLHVGDRPKFTLTWQNTSDKPIYVTEGTITGLGFVITPSDNALLGFGGNQASPSAGTETINPNQTSTVVAFPDPTYGHLDLNTFRYSGFDYGQYLITKAGILHVTMELFLRTHGPTGGYDIMDTIQFDVNATQ